MLLSSLRLGRRLPGLLRDFPLPRPRPSFLTLTLIPASRKMGFHAYAGNPLKDRGGSDGAADSLSSLLRGDGGGDSHKILPLRKGRPLARPEVAAAAPPSPPPWRLCWLSSGFTDFPAESFVYLGSNSPEYGGGGAHYWAFDANEEDSLKLGINVEQGSNFVELRTLMVATDWTDERAMGELAIAGHAKALLEWHNSSRFCGHCGAATSPIDAGRRKECSNDSCKKRSYPRVDPVVIMLVVDKVNDRVLLSRQSRYVPRMWSCLAGFAEPGESLEEAVRRETWEETGIEVGEVVYHSSQPWPVGPSSMPCQLMVGFTAHAKSFDIRVDKKELEDAQWHSREDVTRALTFTEYETSRRTAAVKVNDMFGSGNGRNQLSEAVTKISNAELAPMFVPGPYAIAHHLISSWVNQGSSDGPDSPSQKSTSLSSL